MEMRNKKRERHPYNPPAMVEYGSVVTLTMGDGGSKGWDVGAGFKEDKGGGK